MDETNPDPARADFAKRWNEAAKAEAPINRDVTIKAKAPKQTAEEVLQAESQVRANAMFDSDWAAHQAGRTSGLPTGASAVANANANLAAAARYPHEVNLTETQFQAPNIKGSRYGSVSEDLNLNHGWKIHADYADSGLGYAEAMAKGGRNEAGEVIDQVLAESTNKRITALGIDPERFFNPRGFKSVGLIDYKTGSYVDPNNILSTMEIFEEYGINYKISPGAYGAGRHISAYPQTLQRRDEVTALLEGKLGGVLQPVNDPAYRINLRDKNTGVMNHPISEHVNSRFNTEYMAGDGKGGINWASQEKFNDAMTAPNAATERVRVLGGISQSELNKLDTLITEHPEFKQLLHGEEGYKTPYKTIEDIISDRMNGEISPTFWGASMQPSPENLDLEPLGYSGLKNKQTPIVVPESLGGKPITPESLGAPSATKVQGTVGETKAEEVVAKVTTSAESAPVKMGEAASETVTGVKATVDKGVTIGRTVLKDAGSKAKNFIDTGAKSATKLEGKGGLIGAGVAAAAAVVAFGAHRHHKTQEHQRSSGGPSEASQGQRGGSFEGYMQSSGAHIQMNGAGYDNPEMQTARFKPIDSGISDSGNSFSNVNLSNLSPRSAIMNNYSDSHKAGSTPDRMKSWQFLRHVV